LYVGDFNSHNVEWEYDQNDDKGNKLQEWIVLHSMKLIYKKELSDQQGGQKTTYHS
jgi:hypothetical protein